MSEQAPIDEPQVSINAFKLVMIGFLLGTSLTLLDWIIYRMIQDLIILADVVPLMNLWLSNVLSSVVHISIIAMMYVSIRKKLNAKTLNWQKLLDQSKYLLSIAILAYIFIAVYWDSMLPPRFFAQLDIFNFAASESLIYPIVPLIFTLINVGLALIFLKRLSDQLEKV
jgi:hypothetical protein